MQEIFKVDMISGHGTNSMMIPPERPTIYLDIFVWDDGKEKKHCYVISLDGEGKPNFREEVRK